MRVGEIYFRDRCWGYWNEILGWDTGSGRKPKKKPNYDLKFKRAILRAARKLVRKHGKPIEEAVLELVYLPETQDAVKVAIWKTYLEMFMVKKSEKDVTVKDKTIGPRIGLPPMREDSALKIVKGGDS